MHFSDFGIRAWLIACLDRRGMLSYLVAAVRRERPGMI